MPPSPTVPVAFTDSFGNGQRGATNTVTVFDDSNAPASLVNSLDLNQ